jgi:hypothetical protein
VKNWDDFWVSRKSYNFAAIFKSSEP